MKKRIETAYIVLILLAVTYIAVGVVKYYSTPHYPIIIHDKETVTKAERGKIRNFTITPQQWKK